MKKQNASADPKLSGWSRRDDESETRPYADEEPATPSVSAGPMTPSIKTLQPADAPIGEPGDNEEDRLDEALQESMTTSDPVSIKIA